MPCSPPPATTLASSYAGWRGFCAPCSRRSSQQSRTPNQLETRRTKFFTTDYIGAYTAVKRFLAATRPENGPKPYEVRFETPPGVQAQVDFARFAVEFADD